MGTVEVLTYRQKILQQVVEVLEDVSYINSVELERSTPLSFDSLPYPVCFVYTGRETRVTDEDQGIFPVNGFETFNLEVLVEVWSNENNLEQLLGLIHQKLFDNRYLGGYALLTRRTAVDTYFINPSKEVRSMVAVFTIGYRHTQGNPYIT